MGYFEEIIEDLLLQEGGYVNNIHDKGGETNFGITIKTAHHYGYTASMKDMTKEVAIGIYRQGYWMDRYEDYIKGLAHFIFDMGVNHSPTTQARIIQLALKDMSCDVKVDGYYGVVTHKEIVNNNTLSLLGRCIQRRQDYYEKRCREKEDQRIFLKGWINRCVWFRDKYLSV